MKAKTKLGLILGLAYGIDRIFYPDKYKKKEPELTGELKYTTSTGEVISKKIEFENTDKARNENVPKYQCHVEDPEIWMKKQKQIAPIIDKAERYYEKAEDCKDRDRAIIYYRQSIDNWGTVVRITHQPSDFRELLSVCWASDLIDEVEKYLNEWLKEIPNDNDAHANLARLYVRNKDIEKAKAEYLRAIFLNPRDYNYCEDLAKLYLDEGDFEKAIDVYRVPLEYFCEDPYAGLNLYETYIKLCLKYNRTNQILKMIPEIFIKLDEMISGKRKATIYSEQEPEFYIHGRKKFGKNIGEMIEREVKVSFKENNIPKAKELVESFDSTLQNIKSNELIFKFNILKARLFRKGKEFNKSWALYNQSLPFSDGKKDLSLLYADMGEQLIEENKVQDAVGMFLLSLSFTEKFPAANSGLKRALKQENLSAHYEGLIDVVKNVKDYNKLKECVRNLYIKRVL